MPSQSETIARCQVKVCGVREPSDAAALDALGVDWIGFNFHPASARYIEPAAAAPLVRSLRRAAPVGVFVDADPEHVAHVIRVTDIRYVQLHGSEDAAYLAKMTLPIIKAIPHARLADIGGLRDSLADPAAPPGWLLVDTQVAGKSGPAFGGTGQVFDWNLLAQHPLPRPLFLAGGLGPHNLAEALKAKPFAVDLNSKVEIAPGRKDLAKVSACLEIVRGH
jgi:phosphoribosylanthranilate isomerase